jgi:hypothetical protein
VTERRRAEEQLQALNENLDRLVEERTRALEQLEAELREAGRRKDEFIATLATSCAIRSHRCAMRHSCCSTRRTFRPRRGRRATSSPAKCG